MTKWIFVFFLLSGIIKAQTNCNCGQNTGQLLIDENYIKCCAVNKIINICGNFTSAKGKPAIKLLYNNYNDYTIVIKNSTLTGPDSLFYSYDGEGNGWNHKVIIQNCKFISQRPNIKCGRRPLAATMKAPALFIFENNYLEQSSGIWILGVGTGIYKDYYQNAIIKVRYNNVLNIDGRSSRVDGVDTYYKTAQNVDCPSGGANFIQLHSMYGMNQVDISWNQIINNPDESYVGDDISIFNSGGKILNGDYSIKIHDNYIQGGYTYPANQNQWMYGGGGIMLADSPRDVINGIAQPDNPLLGCYVMAYNNSLVNVTGYGMAIASGHHNQIFNNRIISSGKDRNDEFYNTFGCTSNLFNYRYKLPAIYIYPFYHGGCLDGTTNLPSDATNFLSNIAFNNYIRWTVPAQCDRLPCNNCAFDSKYLDTQGYQCQYSDIYLRCGTDPTKDNNCGEASIGDEYNEYLLWLKKLKDNNIIIGVIPNGSGALTRQVPMGFQQNQTFTAYNEVTAINGTTLLPGSIMQLSDFSFTVCLTNNNPSLPSARLDAIDTIANKNNFKNDSVISTGNYTLYPNPSIGELNIEVKNNETTQLNISLTNSLGTYVFANKIIDKIGGIFSLDLNNLADGIYFIKLNDKTISKNLKFVLQR